MKEIKKLGSVTRFRTNLNWYVAKKPCAEMQWLKQIFQIISRASIWQGNLTYHTFLRVNFLKKFCRVVGTIYTLLYMLLFWLSESDTVVDQELGSGIACFKKFKGVTRVWHARHTYRDCYEFHLWKSFLYEMAIWQGPSQYQHRQMPWHCIWGPGIAWAKGIVARSSWLFFLLYSE